MDIISYVSDMPKAELHLHIEGTLEPEMMMALAKKHGVVLPYATLEDVHAAYNFSDLQSFLDLYYFGASVLREESDFFDLMWAYLVKCRQQNIVHTEIMFDPQTHTDRGIAFEVMMRGYLGALKQAEAEWGQSSKLIMCFLRHLSQASAFETLRMAEPFRDEIDAVGLDSGELGNPPEKFTEVFTAAAQQGYQCVAHAGEEGPPAYIWGALNSLNVTRIDHGVRCLEDDELVEQLVRDQTPLTVCPLSNVRLCVVDEMKDHPILAMLDKGLLVTVNSDDPPYFGGYLNDNFLAMVGGLGLNQAQAKQLAANSFKASFLDEDKKVQFLDALEAF
jgi:adenosine deaminase|tara:strand:+ start:1218 stop:2216 length:999 start_codon:yes stop_codon:yes gene_type:complete